MKIAVINFSGNVGKTTIAAHLLSPRMNGAPVFSIESINQDASKDGVDVEKMRGKHFGRLREELLLLDDAIIDVGASNIEEFLKLMTEYHGSHTDIDCFLIPVVKEKKQQTDSMNTIKSLKALGVPQNKIKVVFNKVEVDSVIDEDFSMFVAAGDLSVFSYCPEAVIRQNEFYESVKGMGMTASDFLKDQTDYRSQARAEKDPDVKYQLVRKHVVRELAYTANQNLDAVFAALFAKQKTTPAKKAEATEA